MRCITESKSCRSIVDLDDMKSSACNGSNTCSSESDILIECSTTQDDSSSSSSSTGSTKALHGLRLPLVPEDSTDACLKSNPLLCSEAIEALKNKVDTYSWDEKQVSASPIIYVHQREVAHASTEQYESKGAILTSDNATTCHVLAFRSCAQGENNSKALGSLCHLDTTRNGSCILKMINEHMIFHRCGMDGSSPKEKQVLMDVHIVGGYNDEDKTSEEITNHVFDILSKAAREFNSTLIMTLKTCVVTSLNDVGRYNYPSASGPMARGLLLDVSSGQVNLLKSVNKNHKEPASTLRRVRLWAPPAQNDYLLVVHMWDKEEICIEPFQFGPFPDMDLFLQLPDNTLLEYSSTSPECEADDFCDEMRETVKYMRDVPMESVFGRESKVVTYALKKLSSPHDCGISCGSCWVRK